MGDVRMCFDTRVYQRALADAEAVSLDVSGEETELSGKYYCDYSAAKDFLIDLGTRVTGYNKGDPFWVDSAGRMFQIIEADDLPQGIEEVVWGAEWGAEPFFNGRDGRGDATKNLMYQSLREFYQCEVKGNKKCVEDVEKNVGVGRDKLEAKKTAEAEAKRQKEAAEAETQRRAEEAKKVATEQQRQAAIADYIRKGNEIWTKAQQLIDLAEKCDDGPFGIDPDDLREVRNDYLTKKIMPTNLTEAKEYYEIAQDMFGAMVMNSSGYKCIEERGEEMGCSYSHSESGVHNDCGPGYEGGHYSYRQTVYCPVIDFKETKSGSAGGCTEKPMRGKGH